MSSTANYWDLNWSWKTLNPQLSKETILKELKEWEIQHLARILFFTSESQKQGCSWGAAGGTDLEKPKQCASF